MAQPRFVNLDEMAKELSLTNVIIAPLAVTGDKVDFATLAGFNLIPNTITANEMAPGAIDSNALGVNSVSADKLNADVFGAGIVPNGGTNAIDVNVDNITLDINSDVVRVKAGGINQTHINVNGSLSLNNQQLTDFRIENVGSDPSAGNEGRIVYRTDLKELRLDDGITFVPIGTGGGGGHVIEDEGVGLPQRAVMNFVGAGVTASDVGGKTLITIPGGGAGSFAKDLFTVVNPLDKNLVLANTPIANSENVAWNGLVLEPGVGNDYIIVGNTITINASIVLTTGDKFVILYAF